MSDDVSRRARTRAAEAKERARIASARAAELAAGRNQAFSPAALERARRAADRAALLAAEGYRNAAAAERSAGQAHEAVADSLDARAARGAGDEPALRADAAKHREEARQHFDNAVVDEERLAALESSSDRQPAT